MAENQVTLPLDPLPDIVIWSKKLVGPIGDNPIEGPFWNINEWGVNLGTELKRVRCGGAGSTSIGPLRSTAVRDAGCRRGRRVLTYILRRILYSVPVLIIASFLVFWGIRTHLRPDREVPHVAGRGARHRAEAQGARARRADRRAVVDTGSPASCTATSARASAPATRCRA